MLRKASRALQTLKNLFEKMVEALKTGEDSCDAEDLDFFTRGFERFDVSNEFFESSFAFDLESNAISPIAEKGSGENSDESDCHLLLEERSTAESDNGIADDATLSEPNCTDDTGCLSVLHWFI